MIFEILVAISIGIICGIITGLTPGIHINLISGLVVSYIYIFESPSPTIIAIFILSMGITHSFVDFIPSLIFGLPDSDTLVSILPGHRLTLQGRALEALYLSIIGSIGGLFVAFLFGIVLFYFLEQFYEQFTLFIPYILLLTILLLIIREEDPSTLFWTLFIVIISASLGMLLLNSHLITNPLLIIFTGIFGLASLLYSLQENITLFPKQDKKHPFKLPKESLKALSLAGIAGTLCGTLPGLGNAQAATMSAAFAKRLETENFIIILGAINTITFILSFVTLYILDKSRNGAVVAISSIITQFTIDDLLLYAVISIIVSLLSAPLTYLLGKKILTIVQTINFKLFTSILIIFISLLIMLMTGIYGFFATLVCTSLGLLCILLNVSRIHLMNILIIPVFFTLL